MKARSKLKAIREIMYPGGDMDHEWSADTLGEIAQVLSETHLTKAQQRAMDRVLTAHPCLNYFDSQTGEQCLFVRTFVHLWETGERSTHGIGTRLLEILAEKADSAVQQMRGHNA